MQVPFTMHDPGTRPGLQGQTLISFGQPDMDRIFGGGVALGQIILIIEDGVSSHHVSLQRYFLGEGVACGQKSLVINCSNLKRDEISIPALLDKKQSDEVRKMEAQSSDKTKDQEEEGQQLRIAWQYKRYIGNKSSGSQAFTQTKQSSSSQPISFKRKNALQSGIAKEWCHVFDLSKQMHQKDQLFKDNQPESVSLQSISFNQKINQFVELVSSIKDMRHPHSVGRIIISSLGNPFNQEFSDSYLLRLLLVLRSMVRDSRCTALLTCPLSLFSRDTQIRAQHLADKIVQLLPLQDDSQVYKLSPDQQNCVGLMKLIGLRDQFFVLRQRRRRLRIDHVEIDPDAEFGGGQEQQKQMQNVPGAMCSGPVSKIDF
eukprot:TRINITY_DN32750_c0_g1_i1.p1 TRINITY_DN32750_c0_g1~~TRINITY_DN32750_c0_g1_i1.p1  ORF type:complete len:372 (-),score=31.91 TRINITY_DN32750_c0_g1_i1:117-1232(-)